MKGYYNIYFLESGIKKRKSLIYSALLKYGYSNFTLEILEYCDSSETIQRDQYYLDLLKPEYNISPLATNSIGWKHSEEILAKMRENYSEERVGNINKGKTLSQETRELIRKAALLREPMSIESRMKCATNMRPVTITNLDGSNPIHFISIKEASIAISCGEKTIRRALNGNGVIKKIFLVKATKDSIE